MRPWSIMQNTQLRLRSVVRLISEYNCVILGTLLSFLHVFNYYYFYFDKFPYFYYLPTWRVLAFEDCNIFFFFWHSSRREACDSIFLGLLLGLIMYLDRMTSTFGMFARLPVRAQWGGGILIADCLLNSSCCFSLSAAILTKQNALFVLYSAVHNNIQSDLWN